MGNDDTENSFFAIRRELRARSPESRRSFSAGVRLIAQGFPVEHVHFVFRGTIKFSYVERSGREFISNLRSGPCMVGAEAALLDCPSLVTATTLNDCEVGQYAASDFRKALDGSANLSFHISRSVARESLTQTSTLIDTVSGSARYRLLAFQSVRGQKSDGKYSGRDSRPTVYLKKNEIAKLLTITPEHLSRLIRALKREGLLDCRGQRLALNATPLARERSND